MQIARIEEHTRARQMMSTANYLPAVQSLLSTLVEHGPHIRLICDLASCYYMIGDYENYRLWTLKAHKEYEAIRHVLSFRTRISACLGIGKLLEELGFLNAALRLYQSETSEVPEIFCDKIQAAILRLACLKQDKNLISKTIVFCEMRNIKDCNAEIDTQHSLMHADIFFKDYQTAVARAKRLIEQKIGNESDERLIIFDLLFELIRFRQEDMMPKSLIQMHKYSDLDSFEKLIFDIYFIISNQVPNQEVNLFRTEELPLMTKLRSLLLMCRIETSGPIRNQIQKKIYTYCRQLDPTSRSWVLSAWNDSDFNLSKNIIIMENGITVDGQVIQLERSRQTWQLISMFQGKSEISTEVVAREIYGIELNVSILNRIKVLLSKSNKILEVELGIAKAFSFSLATIRLRAPIKIGRSA